MQDPIPPDIQDFVLRHIDSIAHMEALLMLWREASQGWQPDAVAARLYIPVSNAEAVLERLAALGLLRKESGRFHCDCASPQTHEMVARLAGLYASHLIPITNLIHAKRENRIQQFADAFKLRKGD